MPRPTLDVPSPNAVHQAYRFFPSHDRLPRERKVYKYTLKIVYVATRFKFAETLVSKDSTEISRTFQIIYVCTTPMA